MAISDVKVFYFTLHNKAYAEGGFLLWKKRLTKESKSGSNVRELIQQKRRSFSANRLLKNYAYFTSYYCPRFHFNNCGIIFTLLSETIEFFKRVPFVDFFTGTILKPLEITRSLECSHYYGTLLSSAIAMIVAVPIGLMTAIYLSEYATDRVRKVVKPIWNYWLESQQSYMDFLPLHL